MVNIYILELEGGKYYVGKTNHTFKRFRQHVDGDGAKWTQKYSPKDVYEFHKDMKDIDERKITIQMMKEFGVENVRGGPWTKVNMTTREKLNLSNRIKRNTTVRRNSKKKSCTRCGRTSHTVERCYARYHSNGKSLTRKKKLKPNEFGNWIKYQAARKKQSSEQAKTVEEKESISKDIEILNQYEDKTDAEKIELMETVSEKEHDDTIVGVIKEIRYSVLGLIKDTKATTNSVLKTTKRKTVNSKKKIEKIGKKIGRTFKKNLGLK